MEAVALSRDSGVLWGIGQRLYKYVSKSEPTEGGIKSFMNVCPPFRGYCYALVMSWYNWSLRVPTKTATAGRSELMMAAYLPPAGEADSRSNRA